MPRWAMTVSAVSVLLALALWAMALHKLQYSRRFVTTFLLVLGFSEPFVSMATKARYEYFSFLLMSLAIYLAVCGVEFAGLLLAFLAVETQPAAVAAPIVLIVLLSLLRKWRTRQILQAAVAALAAFGLYTLLHPAAIAQIIHGGHATGPPPAGANMHRGGFALAYFADRRRHLPELLLFALGLAACWRKRNQFQIKWPLWTSVALLCLSVALIHGNVAYMVFLYPFLVLATLKAFEKRTAMFVAAGMVFYCAAQYAYLIRMNHGEGWRTSDLHAMSQAIDLAKADIHKADPHIYGDYTVWFAHPRYFEAAGFLTQADAAKADIYLCFDRPLMPPGWVSPDTPTCADLKSQTPLIDFSSLMVRNHLLHVMTHPN